MPSQGDKNYFQDDEGLWIEKVGPWVKDKHRIITDYVQISSATRRKFQDCAFIDIFSGPGKSLIRNTKELVDGSSVAAFKKSVSSHPFSQIHVSDADAALLSSVETRLRKLSAPVVATAGPASVALPRILDQLSKSGLHLAVLDPHNLGTLSFDLFESLAKLDRIDIVVHVSLSDLQRNVDRYTSIAHEQFDRFAPDWRSHVSTNQNQAGLRASILNYWTEKVVGLGLPRAKHCELIRGSGSQRLYWLMFLARHDLPHSFWNKINSSAKQHGFEF